MDITPYIDPGTGKQELPSGEYIWELAMYVSNVVTRDSYDTSLATLNHLSASSNHAPGRQRVSLGRWRSLKTSRLPSIR
jgi:hypothetical protein